MIQANALLQFDDVSDLSKDFGLKHISFALEPGYILGIQGKNRAGKTTLLQHIVHQNMRYQGKIYFEGIDIKQDAIYLKDQIASLSEEEIFFTSFTIDEQAFLLGQFYSNWSKDLFYDYIRAYGLHKEQQMSTLSRGEWMRYQLAFSLAHKPKLFLIDEATAGLDVLFVQDFYKSLREALGDTASAIIVSHKETELKKYADFIACMQEGSLISFCENLQ